MDIAEYKNMYESEANHFYYRGYHEILIDILKKELKNRPQSKKIKILDAGCGAGLFAKKLQKFGDVHGFDFSSEAVKFAKKRGLKVKQGSVTKVPYPSDSFDVIVCIDVLCHQSIPREEIALKEFHRVLKKDGILMVKLPALNWLKGSHDIHTHTKKRYYLPEVTQLIKKTRFSPIRTTYLASFLVLPVAMKSLLEKVTLNKKGHSGITNINKTVNNIMLNVFRIEKLLLSKVNMPIGLTLLVVAKKK